jgi:transcriptional regulator with XRE-family HTH domain
MTQDEVAKKTGIPRTTLMYWERTGNLAGRTQILRLARAYRVPVHKLLRAEKTTTTPQGP